jgi:hypothetical protein
MKSEVNITSEVDSVQFGWWDDKNEDFIPLNDEDAVRDFLKHSDYRSRLIDAINMLAADIAEKVGEDLKDIWKRQDDIERRLNADIVNLRSSLAATEAREKELREKVGKALHMIWRYDNNQVRFPQPGHNIVTELKKILTGGTE